MEGADSGSTGPVREDWIGRDANMRHPPGAPRLGDSAVVPRGPAAQHPGGAHLVDDRPERGGSRRGRGFQRRGRAPRRRGREAGACAAGEDPGQVDGRAYQPTHHFARAAHRLRELHVQADKPGGAGHSQCARYKW